MVDRQSVIFGASLIGAATIADRSVARAAPPPRPRRNVLLLMSDDQGLDLGFYGVAIKTPRLGCLARESTRFSGLTE